MACGVPLTLAPYTDDAREAAEVAHPTWEGACYATRYMLRRIVSLCLLVVSTGCGDDGETAPPDDPCPAPNEMVDGRCVEPETGCPAGSLPLEDGSCQTAGVPATLCAEGFVHDGDAACEPTLPASPCPAGQMAIPGEIDCRPVMDCGTGTWGNIPVDANTIYVDATYAGGNSDGSQGQPFTNIGAAVNAATDGASIAVAAGSYPEDLWLTKPVQLWGRCPQMVSVTGLPMNWGTVIVYPTASGSEVHGLAVTGGDTATVTVSGAQNVLLEHLWVSGGTAIGVAIAADVDRGTATLRNSLVEDAETIGIVVHASDANIDRVVVRDTVPKAGTLELGHGIHIEPDVATSTISTANVTRSLLERNHEVGLFVGGAEATIDGVVVVDTLPRPSNQLFGRGISIQLDPATSTVATVTRSFIARNHEVGVSVSGGEATLDGVVIRDTLARPSDQRFGRGVHVQADITTHAPASFTITRSLIVANREFGIAIPGSQASLESVLVRDTLARPADDLFGDGIAVVSFDGPTEARLSGCLIDGNARAGLSNFGAHVGLARTMIRCNSFELSAETYNNQPYAIDDLCDNSCGCPEAADVCKAVSVGLAPPEPLGEL
jgi:hypothetical protein